MSPTKRAGTGEVVVDGWVGGCSHQDLLITVSITGRFEVEKAHLYKKICAISRVLV